ncbi:MAG: hypothetical protein DRP64_00200, partial [Verrucomicrobia bacterium]
MRMRTPLVLLTVVAISSIAVAGPDWNDAGSDHSWTNGANWAGGFAPATGGADNNPAIHGQAVGPTIDAAVPYQWNVWHGVFGSQPGAVIITTTNASLICHEYVMGNSDDTYTNAIVEMDAGWFQADKFTIGNSQSAQVNISGGIMTAYNPGNELFVGGNTTNEAWARGRINITGTGDVRADTLYMNLGWAQNDSRIQIEDAGLLKVRGDQTGAGTDLMAYIGTNWIYTTNAGYVIEASYDPVWNETIVRSAPAGRTGYEIWADNWHLTGDAALSTADTEPDGMENMLEYVLGGSPYTNDATAVLPTSEFTMDSIEYVYQRRLDADDRGLVYGLVLNTNGLDSAWDSATTNYETSVVALDAYFESVTNTISITGVDVGFVNLEVMEN